MTYTTTTVTASESATALTVAWNGSARYTTGNSTASVTLNKTTGEVTYVYGPCNSRGGIVGVSPGGSLFAVIPAEIDMSTLTLFTAATALDPVYEQMLAGSDGGADGFDLSGMTIGFTPTGGVGVGPYLFHRPWTRLRILDPRPGTKVRAFASRE